MIEDVLSLPDVVLDFWAPWCQPCLALVPIVTRWEADGLVPVVRINVDTAPHLAAQFAVRSIPTLIRVQHGQEVGRAVGSQPESALKQALQL